MSKKIQRPISILTSITTIAWLSGIAMLAPFSVGAAVIDGDIVSPDAEYTEGGVTYYPYDVFIVKIVGDKTFKRLILNPQVFESYGHLEWGNIQTISASTVEGYTLSNLVRELNDTKVYKLTADGDVGTKGWVNMTAAEFESEGYDWDSIYVINVTDRDNYTTGSDVTVGDGVAGGLTVAIASDTPATAMVPESATSVVYTKINFTAGDDGDVTISQLVFKRSDLGEADDFDNVYLYEDSVRLTDGRSVSAASHNVTFINLDLTITKSTTKTLVVKADMSSDSASSNNAFGLVSADSITSDATSITGSFPITGNPMSVSSVADAGTVTIAALSDPANPNVGSQGATLARFSLAATSEDMTLNELSLIVKGTVNNDQVTNLELKRADDVLATDDALDSTGRMYFVLDTPYAMEDGDTRNFEVTGDITGEVDDTVQIYLDEDTDLLMIGSEYGYGCAVTNDDYDGSAAAKRSDLTLQGGTVTVTFNGPATANVGKDTNDTVLMDFAVSAERFVTIKEMDLQFQGTDLWDTTDGDYIRDLKVKNADTGTTISGPKELIEDDDDETLTFTDDFEVNAGETLNLQITADIQSTVTDSDDYYVTIVIDEFDVEDANNDTVTDIVPSSDIQGNTMTVEAASLTVALAGTPAASEPTDHTYVAGYSGAAAVGFSFTTVEASLIEVTDLTLSAYVTGKLASTSAMKLAYDTPDSDIYAKDVVSSVSIYKDSVDPANLIAGPETITTAGLVTFDNFSWTIPAATTEILIVGIDLSTTAPYGSDSDFVSFDIATVGTDITCYDKDSNVVTVSSTSGVNGATDPSVFVEVATTGTLTTAVSGAPVAAMIVAGDTDVSFNRIKFTSSNEAFLVDKITVRIDDATNDADNVQRVEISYLDQNDETVTQQTVLVGSDAVFSGCTFWVPKDGSSYLTISADLSTVLQGADSTDAFQLYFRASAAADFHAVGQDSGELIQGDDSGVQSGQGSGNSMTLFRSRPTIAQVAIPGYTGSLIPTSQKLAIFTITAEGHDINFTKTSGAINFDVVASGQAGNNTPLYLKDWNDIIVASVTADLSGGVANSVFEFDEDAGGVTIPEGETKELYVYGSLVYFADDGDFFQLRLEDDDANDFEWMDDDREAYRTERDGPVNQIPGLDIDFESFIRNI